MATLYLVFDYKFHNSKPLPILMANKLNKYTVTVIQTIASEVEVEANSEKEAEDKALETQSYQRENHRVVSKYCKVKDVPLDK